MTTRSPTRRLLALPAVLILFLAACGGDDSDGDAAAADTTPVAADDGATDDGATDDEAPEDDESPAAGAGTALDVVALDIAFQESTPSVPAGEVTVTMVNEGQINHTLVITGLDGFRLATPNNGDTDSSTVTLEPGLYEFFCDVPGHVDAGMVGTLAVT